ncbi:UNVERIFIED_CONTAM: Pentatricopeptide repeat-containing protein, mitochondrial [Sesamum radiatum]|uniref:Pentatricopeptide repeat-containing protein, mitochondrial n=1 Tax=Sesamum radiatum TaxID=300843 RepID=A0AAW2SZN6_SESRA
MLTKLTTPPAVSLVKQKLSPHFNHHSCSWNSLFRAHFNSWAFSIRRAAASSSPLMALQLYSRMQRQAVPFDSFSILFALKSCTYLPHNITILRHIHAHLLKLGFSTHVYVATSLLCAYAPSLFKDACILFDEMPLRNTVTWNIMITAYSRQGDVTTARIFFDRMPVRDVASWSAMIAAYMDNSLWDQGCHFFVK